MLSLRIKKNTVLRLNDQGLLKALIKKHFYFNLIIRTIWQIFTRVLKTVINTGNTDTATSVSSPARIVVSSRFLLYSRKNIVFFKFTKSPVFCKSSVKTYFIHFNTLHYILQDDVLKSVY